MLGDQTDTDGDINMKKSLLKSEISEIMKLIEQPTMTQALARFDPTPDR
jgi:hypothetical protein